jgi:hypothetical protein
MLYIPVTGIDPQFPVQFWFFHEYDHGCRDGPTSLLKRGRERTAQFVDRAEASRHGFLGVQEFPCSPNLGVFQRAIPGGDVQYLQSCKLCTAHQQRRGPYDYYRLERQHQWHLGHPNSRAARPYHHDLAASAVWVEGYLVTCELPGRECPPALPLSTKI